MKYVIAFALFVAVATSDILLTDEEKTKLHHWSDECVASTHVSKDLIKKMRENHFEEDAHLKDYLFCMFKKMDWQHDDGSIDKDHIKSNVSKSQVALDAMHVCWDKHGSTGSETAWVVFKCYKEHLPAGFKGSL